MPEDFNDKLVTSSDEEIEKTPKTESEDNPDNSGEVLGAIDPAESTVDTHPAVGAQPTFNNAAVMPVGPGLSRPAKSNKKLVAGIVIAAVSVLLIGGGVGAYFLYQNPQKVLGDAISSMFTANKFEANGTLSLKSTKSSNDTMDLIYKVNSTRFSGTIDASMKGKADGRAVSLDGSFAYSEQSDMYFKVSGMSAFMDEYARSSGETVPANVTSLLKKVDGKWYVITNADMKEASPDYAKFQQCVTDVYHEADKDSKLLKEVGDVYAKNQFVVTEKDLGVKNGSIGYQVGLDNTKAKEFGNAVKETQLYKKIKACDTKNSYVENATPSSTSSSSSDKPTVELWVDQWSHQPTKLVVTGKNGTTSYMSETTMKLNAKTTVNIPSGATSFKELQKDIQELMQPAYTSIQERADASTNQVNASHVRMRTEIYYANAGVYPTLDQLLAARDEAKLSDTVRPLVSASAPSATNPGIIQYQKCSDAGGVIRYYNTATSAVVSVDFGSGCKAV